MALTQMRPTLSLVETFFLAKYLETLVNVEKYVYWSSLKPFATIDWLSFFYIN